MKQRIISILMLIAIILGVFTSCDLGKTPEKQPCKVHAWAPWQVSIAPTATSDGLEMRLCQNCPASETRLVPATGDQNGGDGNGGTQEPPIDDPNCESSHADADNNGKCDRCSISVTITLDFFSLNDLHGKFDDTDTQPGVDELTTYLKQAKAANPNTIFLSAGDMWQGSAESNLTRGAIMVEWMNALGFTAMALGNHEFDWGEDAIRENAEKAEFPFLAINIYNKNTNQRVEYAKPSTMVDLGEVQIGIIGAIGNCYSSIAEDKTREIYFKTGAELTALVKAEAESLRAQGADFIVYCLHDGNENDADGSVRPNAMAGYYDAELSNGLIDLVFEGHTHQFYSQEDKYGVAHLQNGGENKGLAHANVTLNFANKKANVTAKIVPAKTYKTYAADPLIDELLAKYDAIIGGAHDVLGYNASYLNSNQIKAIVAKLYYEKGVEIWGDEYDIVLGGGYIGVRSPYNLPVGNVTYADLLMLLPFDNDIILCSISGAYIESRFFNNAEYAVSYGAYGESVKKNINKNKTYYVIVDSYCADYYYNMLTEVDRLEGGIYARDLMADYARAGGLSGKSTAMHSEGGTILLAACLLPSEIEEVILSSRH